MILASVKDYVHVWQLGLLMAFLFVWLMGGSYFIRRVLKKFPELPKSERSMNRAFQVNFLATGAGLLAMLIVGAFMAALAMRTGILSMLLVGAIGGILFGLLAALVALVAFLAMAWVVMQSMLPMPSRQLLGVTIRGSGIVLLGAIVLGATAIVPAISIRGNDLRKGNCQMNVLNLNGALGSYSSANPGRSPASLQELVDQHYLDKKYLECPGRPGQIGYVYVSAPGGIPQKDPKAPVRVVLSDRPGNHKNDNFILYSNGNPDRLDDQRLAALLDKPENKEFKAAWEKAK